MTTIIIVALLFSITFSLLGCISLWKKYIFLADGLSHASMLVVVVSNMLNLHLIFTGVSVSILFALLIFKFQNIVGRNVAVNIITNVMLAVALLIAVKNPVKINIMQLLFGDIITANRTDIYTLFMVFIATLVFVAVYYKDIVFLVLNRDMAYVQGVPVKRIELIFLALLSLAVFIAIKIVGALLVNTVMLLPPVTAKIVSKTPSQMMITSMIIALFICIIGLLSAFYYDFPVAPVIILIGGILYFTIFCLWKILKKE